MSPLALGSIPSGGKRKNTFEREEHQLYIEKPDWTEKPRGWFVLGPSRLDAAFRGSVETR